jgi:hypothetical protein
MSVKSTLATVILAGAVSACASMQPAPSDPLVHMQRVAIRVARLYNRPYPPTVKTGVLPAGAVAQCRFRKFWRVISGNSGRSLGW